MFNLSNCYLLFFSLFKNYFIFFSCVIFCLKFPCFSRGVGSSASGSSRSQGGHKRAPLMSGSEIGDSVSVLSSRRYSPSEKSQMMMDPSQQQSFNMPVTHPCRNSLNIL